MKRIFVMSLLLTMTLLSCENSTVTIENGMMQSQRIGYVPLAFAEQVAGSFISLATLDRSKGQSARRAAKSIKESITVNDNAGKPAFYVINYDDNQGFVIVFAEKKIHPILAFNGVGSFQINALQSGSSLWIEGLKKMTNFIRSHKDATALKGTKTNGEIMTVKQTPLIHQLIIRTSV